MSAHTNIKLEETDLLNRPKPIPPFQLADKEKVETIADQLISENLEAFWELAISN